MRVFGKIGVRYSRPSDEAAQMVQYLQNRLTQVSDGDASMAAETLRFNLRRIIYDFEGMRKPIVRVTGLVKL